jgi:hypothetical protein
LSKRERLAAVIDTLVTQTTLNVLALAVLALVAPPAGLRLCGKAAVPAAAHPRTRDFRKAGVRPAMRCTAHGLGRPPANTPLLVAHCDSRTAASPSSRWQR